MEILVSRKQSTEFYTLKPHQAQVPEKNIKLEEKTKNIFSSYPFVMNSEIREKSTS